MLRSIATVMRGTVFAQAIGVVILPLLTRSFDPAAFGHFQVFQSIIVFVLIFATLRYEIAILRAETPVELGAVLAICAAISVILSLTLLAGAELLRYSPWGAVLAGLPFPLWLIPATLLVGGTAQYAGYVLVREQWYGAGANIKVAQAFGNAGVAAGLALLLPVQAGIVLADFAGRCVNVGWTVLTCRHRIHGLLARPAWPDIRAALHRFREYPLVAMPGGIINALSGILTPVMIYGFFDAATSGQFGLVERSVSLPVALVVTAVSQVYTAQLSSALRENDSSALAHFRRIVGFLALVSVGPAIVLMIFAPQLFAFAFGPGWEQSASFARLMAPAYVLALAAGAVNMTLIVVGRQGLQMAWEIGRMASMTALWLGASHFAWPVQVIVAGHSLVLSLFSVILIVLSYRVLVDKDASRLAGADVP